MRIAYPGILLLGATTVYPEGIDIRSGDHRRFLPGPRRQGAAARKPQGKGVVAALSGAYSIGVHDGIVGCMAAQAIGEWIASFKRRPEVCGWCMVRDAGPKGWCNACYDPDTIYIRGEG